MKLPGADEAVVDRRKIVDYLLSAKHPTGRAKAAFFGSFGFAAEDCDRFRDALREHAREGEVVGCEETRFGVKYVVVGVLACPDGRQPGIVTVWFVATRGSAPALVTAYPWSEDDDRQGA